MINLILIASFFTVASIYGLIKLTTLSRQVGNWIEITGFLKEYNRKKIRYGSWSNWLNEDPQGHDCSILLIYRYNNNEYQSRKISPLDFIIPFWGNFSAHANAKIISSRKDNNIKIWVNPNNPKQALIDKEINKHWFTYLSLMFGLSLTMLILFLYYSVSN